MTVPSPPGQETRTARKLDAVVLAAVLVGASLLVLYFTPLAPEAWLAAVGGNYLAPLLQALTIFALIHGRRAVARAERRFWDVLTLGFTVWFAAQLAGFALAPGVVSWLASDVLNLLCFVSLLLALELRPHVPEWTGGKLRFRFTAVATAIFLSVLLLYFVLIPSSLDRAAYDTLVPSYYLFLTLDAVLLARFCALVAASSERRWRVTYGLLALASGGWLLGDLVDCLIYAGTLDVPLGTPLDLPYCVPAFAIVVATRLRNRSSAPPEPARADSIGARAEASALPLAYAFLLPVVHLSLTSAGLFDVGGRGAREVTMLAGFLALVACVYAQHVLLRRRNDDLEDRLTALVTDGELRHTQKMEALGRLAGGVAHDFNNVLLVIRGYADMLLRNAQPNDPVRVRLRRIGDATERGAALVQQLLAFGRRQVVQPTLLRLDDEVASIQSMLRRVIGEDIRLETQLDPLTGCIYFDRGQLAQVVINLVINARDAMPKGGRLMIETGAAELADPGAVPGVAPGDYAVMTVADTGVGMDAETRERIFEPFFTTRAEGTGLGLATVYGIVKQGGGAIRVESRPGHGTHFRLYFPRAEETPDDVLIPAERAAAFRSRRGETVLLVEDEEQVRAVARECLEECGYRVLEAADAEAALRVADAQGKTVDLLLTDVVLPGMSGRELAERLEGRVDAVLFMSGYNDEALLDYGRVAFLQKPFALAEMARSVREVLDAQRSQKA